MNYWTRPLIASFGIVGCALSILTHSANAQNEKDVLVDASGEKLAINGNDFPIGPTVEALIRLWGKPDRTKRAANDIRIWDDLGIRAYSSSGSPSVDSLTFTMRKVDKDLAAKNAFTGRIKAPKGILTKASTADDLKKLGFTENASLSKFYDLDTLMFSFFAEVDEDAGGELVEVSLEVGLGL